MNNQAETTKCLRTTRSGRPNCGSLYPLGLNTTQIALGSERPQKQVKPSQIEVISIKKNHAF